jgi:hypothetical protein
VFYKNNQNLNAPLKLELLKINGLFGLSPGYVIDFEMVSPLHVFRTVAG